VLLSVVVVLFAVLVIALGANAGKPGVDIAIGAIFFAFAGVPLGFSWALVYRHVTKRQPTTYITHQHVHLYGVNDNGQPEQISEASRSVTVTR
jgi:NhaP-type Na+/H+ or K+/H+ antiporter